MEYSKIIKEVGRGKNHARDLDEETARALYARMLDGEVPELELGNINRPAHQRRRRSGDERVLRGDAAAYDAPDPAGRQADADCHPQLQRRASRRT